MSSEDISKSGKDSVFSLARLGLLRCCGRCFSSQTGPRQVLNSNQEDWMYMEPYKTEWYRKIIWWTLMVVSAGLLWLVLLFWRKDWYVRLVAKRTSTKNADVFILQDPYEEYFVSYVYDLAKRDKYYKKLPEGSVVADTQLISPDYNHKGFFEEVPSQRYFDCKRVRYLWVEEEQEYRKLTGIPEVPFDYFEVQKGLNDGQRAERLKLFGLNAIMINVDPILKILAREGLTPFYAFQAFAIVLWFYEPYTVYAAVILAISIVSLGSQVFIIWKQQKELHKRVQDFDLVTIMKEDGSTTTVQSETLVPGDVILIPKNGCKIVCDAVLLNGHCIVNEASLTGESVPVPKVPVASAEKDEVFEARHHGRNILFCGTKVLQARIGSDGYTRAVIIRTGFMTSKGELIRSIMYFRNIDYQFQNQTYWYIGALACIALVGMVYSLCLKILLKKQQEEEGMAEDDPDRVMKRDIVTRSLDLITIVVPPALPAALTVGIIFSQWRLKKRQIYCISPRTINMCGLINLVCFDKTGTLTEDGLDMKSVLSVSGEKSAADTRFSEKDTTKFANMEDPVVRCMASCHSLSIIDSDATEGNQMAQEGSPDMSLLGDPLDLIMFQHTQWRLNERQVAGLGDTLYRVVQPAIGTMSKNFKETAFVVLFKEFPFASTFQRMGAIAYNTEQKRFEFFAKGATERIVPLCRPETVPKDCMARLEEFSSAGNRVIALAWKELPGLEFQTAAKLGRGDAEQQLNFVGLIVFENRIKIDTPTVIEELRQADLRTVMLTGDNINTAISVARSCGILGPNEPVSIVQANDDEMKFVPVEDQEFHRPSDMKANEKGGMNEKTKSDTLLWTSRQESYAELDMENPSNGHSREERLALTGETLQAIKLHHPQRLPQIFLSGTVFARVSPLEKQYMVEKLQSCGYQVAMCGDGANDCGALRAANAGISLSESEAAAAAPFTSTNPSIACVPLVLREGRCALVTFFGIFFLMATYSMCQFISCVLLYWIGQTLTDMEFLYEDLFELTILAVVIGMARPHPRLTDDPVPSSLKSFPSFFSLIGHVLILLASQIAAFEVVQLKVIPCDPYADTVVYNNMSRDDYLTARASAQADAAAAGITTVASLVNTTLYLPDCTYEGYGLWTLGTLQIVFLSFIFAKGAPFRRPLWTNYVHVALAVIMIVCDLVWMLGPTPILARGFKLDGPAQPYIGYRFIFLAIALIYLVVAYFFEIVIVDMVVVRLLARTKKLRWLRSRQRTDVEDDLRAQVRKANRPQLEDGAVVFHNAAFSPDNDIHMEPLN